MEEKNRLEKRGSKTPLAVKKCREGMKNIEQKVSGKVHKFDFISRWDRRRSRTKVHGGATMLEAKIGCATMPHLP